MENATSWGPLAAGFLTGKYQRGKGTKAGARFDKPVAIYSDVMTDANFDKLDKLVAFVRDRGHSVGEMAIAWLLAHPWISSVIAGATKIEQLKMNIAALEWKMTDAEVAEIDKIT